MKSTPVIDVEEFVQCRTHTSATDATTTVVCDHPEFGRWERRIFDLGFGRITEHRTDLHKAVAVRIRDEQLSRNVHHCMCMEGPLRAHFDESRINVDLPTSTYHYMKVPGTTYTLAMPQHFHNVHIEVASDHYTKLLCDSEPWAHKLKERLSREDVCVAGTFSLTPRMIRNIYDIFNTPMSGMLKRLVIEARMLELIALQWGTSIEAATSRKIEKKDTLYDIRHYLHDTFLEEHSLRSICMRFGINEFALKNGFRKQFSTTVFEYIISRRLEHARELLGQPDYSIQQISAIVGYKYPNHFSTAFKNRFGVSPGAFAGRAETRSPQ
jgi:AraC-like DNA-binding protein